MNSLVKDWGKTKKLVEKLLTTTHAGNSAPLLHIVEEILSKKDQFLSLIKRSPTPFYAFDTPNLERAAARFQSAFERSIPGFKAFYAVKVNHYHPLLHYLFSHGFNADVSSSRELQLAVDAGAAQIVFSGPGKTVTELKAAIQHRDKVTLNIDSFGELRKLTPLLSNLATPLRAGIRVSFQSHGAWGKFGIPLERLQEFTHEANKVKNLSLNCIQFHISWNQDAEPYEVAIRELGTALQKLPRELLSQISYIDIGGGFRPYNSEGYYPEDTPLGGAIQGACDAFEEDPDFAAPYYITEAVPIEEYARGIGHAINQYLKPIGDFEYWIEPGRIICNDSMHVVLTIEDVKSPDCVITDGGTNIVGFERFEFDYFPIINLTHPARAEIPCTVYGSLCMPQDYWGHRLYGEKVAPGDIIVVPYQGALTYANMQGFIKGEVPVYQLGTV